VEIVPGYLATPLAPGGEACHSDGRGVGDDCLALAGREIVVCWVIRSARIGVLQLRCADSDCLILRFFIVFLLRFWHRGVY